jgi:inward rectifier potassium channel
MAPKPTQNWDPRNRLVRVGLKSRLFIDLYQRLLTVSWLRLIAAVVVSFVAANFTFAWAYYLTGGGIENAKPGSLSDLFFFSVETMATIGYGKLVPVTLMANVLMTIESLLGLLGFAMVTGLIFTKFARATAGVTFSKNVLINYFDGKPALMLRLGNEGASQIVEAQLRLVVLRREITAEGEEVRRLHDLQLMRANNAFFALTWLAVHQIGPESPLYGATPESLKEGEVQLIASVVGLEEVSTQTVHARFGYETADLLFDQRFDDVITELPDGRPAVDYSKLSDLKPAKYKTAFPLGRPPEELQAKVGT